MKGEKIAVESPLSGDFVGDVENNIKYARQCMRDSLNREEYPFASHLLYAQEGILDDDLPEERAQGIEAGRAWIKYADRCAVYIDKGISDGMWMGMIHAIECNIPVEVRILEK